MTTNLRTLSDTDLELVCGGRMTPTVTPRYGTGSQGNVEINDAGGDVFGEPDSVVG